MYKNRKQPHFKSALQTSTSTLRPTCLSSFFHFVFIYAQIMTFQRDAILNVKKYNHYNVQKNFSFFSFLAFFLRFFSSRHRSIRRHPIQWKLNFVSSRREKIIFFHFSFHENLLFIQQDDESISECQNYCWGWNETLMSLGME